MEKYKLFQKWWKDDGKAPIVTYYSLEDLSLSLFIIGFVENKNEIQKMIEGYKKYEDLLRGNFLFAFYILNVFWFVNDVEKNPEFKNDINPEYQTYYEEIKRFIDEIKDILEIGDFNHIISLYQREFVNNLSDEFLNYFNGQAPVKMISNHDLFVVFRYKNNLNDHNLMILCDFLDTNINLYRYFFINKTNFKNRFKKQFETSLQSLLISFDNVLFKNISDLSTYYLPLIRNEPLKIENYCSIFEKIYFEMYLNANLGIRHENYALRVIKNIWYQNNLTKQFDRYFATRYEEALQNLFNDTKWQKNKLPELSNEAKLSIVKSVYLNESLFHVKEKRTSFDFERNDYSNPLDSLTKIDFSNPDIDFDFHFRSQVIPFLTEKYLNNLVDKFNLFTIQMKFSKKSSTYYTKEVRHILEKFIVLLNGEVSSTNKFFSWKNEIGVIITAINGILTNLWKSVESNQNCPDLPFLLSEHIDYQNREFIFTPSKHFKNLVSDKAKEVLFYFLYIRSEMVQQGKLGDTRNSFAHGSENFGDFDNPYSYSMFFQCFLRFIDELVNNFQLEIISFVTQESGVKFSKKYDKLLLDNPHLISSTLKRIFDKTKKVFIFNPKVSEGEEKL